MKIRAVLLIGAAFVAAFPASVRAGGDAFEASLAAISETAVSGMRANQAPSNGPRTIEVVCASPEGTFHLGGDPATGEFKFELIKGEQRVAKDYSPASCPEGACALRFSADRRSGETRIDGSKLLHEYIEPHRGCSHPRDGPPRCADVPGHYEWNEVEGINIFLSPKGETWLLDIHERYIDPPGDSAHALGIEASCTVEGL